MYLARKRIRGRMRYFIRESIPDGRRMISRELFDLGHDPGKFIVYPDDGIAFYFSPDLIDELEARGVEPDNDVLENIFWSFLKAETRRVINKFNHGPAGANSAEDRIERCDTERFQMFDKRRVHFLRFGALDQTGIERVPEKIYDVLMDKSRDEIEQQFMEMERVLKKTEKKNYIYAIFNVAAHFQSEIARKFPQALDQEKVDGAFLDELCQLNENTAFWSDLGVSDRLNDYLLRYVLWFFDSEFEGMAYLEDLMWQFKRRHHGFAPPHARESMPVEEAVAVMGISRRELDGMNVRWLTRQYRLRARSFHPDKGGSHEQFILLNRAFTNLLRRVKGGGRGWHARR